MKKQLLLSLIFSLFCGIIFGQHLIRVNNSAAADADYLTLQEANDNATTGDTIYVEGSPATYAGAEISRKLCIIGPGYFLSDNDSTQANSLDANIYGTVDFITGSEGSLITGMKVNAIYIRVNEIVITRCNVGDIGFYDNSANSLITQNYATGIRTYSGNLTNSIISNNIVYTTITTGSTSYPLQITNNVVQGPGYIPINVYYSTIANNITTSTNNIAVNTGNTIINNISAGAGTNANGNKYNVVMTTVFVDYSGSLNYSDDAKWKLKAGSPAIGAGVSGVDCGVFGGTTPYVLSGIPALPHIYEAAIPGVAYSGTGLSCTIKVKAGK
ncbi:MAG: hypothetical protein MUO72_12185 [Bacteroidales bacterium]|nr:hypothetical protein [Bacteroidales bacterium]